MQVLGTDVYSSVLHNPDGFLNDKTKMCKFTDQLYEESEKLYNGLSPSKKNAIDRKYGHIVHPTKCGYGSKSELILKNMFGSLDLIRTLNFENEYTIKLLQRYLDMLGNNAVASVDIPITDPVVQSIKDTIDKQCNEDNINNIINKHSLIFLDNPTSDHNILKSNHKEMVGGFTPKTVLSKEDRLTKMSCNKKFLDIVTDLVSKESIFSDNNELYIARFQYMVNTIYNSFIDKYKLMNNLNELDIVFLYKGGTTIKILFDKYKNIFNDLKMDKFIDIVQSSFKRSDSDYTIFINNTLPDFTKHYLNINKISSFLLQLCRQIINNFPNEIVPFNSINSNNINNTLNHIIEQLNLYINDSADKCTQLLEMDEIIGLSFNDVHVINANFNRVPSLRTDTLITWNKHNNDEQLVINIDNTPDNLYLSYNETHEYECGNPSNQTKNQGDKFMLHRMKINFVLYYKFKGVINTLNCPSELIDVSIAKHNSNDLFFFSQHKDLEIMDYNYNHNNTFCVNYKSYSIYGNVIDLLLVLFYSPRVPWESKKYDKRINRLLFFIVLDIFEAYKNDHNKINTLIHAFSDLCNTSLVRDEHSIKHKLSSLIKLSDELPNRSFVQLFFEINRLLPRLSTHTDKINYDTFMSHFYNALQSVHINANVDIQFTGNVPMLGGFHHKYLKYKNKYLTLKHT